MSLSLLGGCEEPAVTAARSSGAAVAHIAAAAALHAEVISLETPPMRPTAVSELSCGSMSVSSYGSSNSPDASPLPRRGW